MHRSPIQVFQDTAVKLLAQPPQGLSLDDVLMRLALLRPDILSQIRAEVDTEAVPTPEGGLRGSLRLHPFEIIPQVTRVVTPWGQHGVVSELALTEAHQERGNFQATLRLDLRSTKNDRARALYLELRPAVPQKTGTGATPEALWRSVEWGLKHLRDKLAAYGRARRARSKGQIAWEGMVAGQEVSRDVQTLKAWLELGLPETKAYSKASVSELAREVSDTLNFFITEQEVRR